MVISSMPPSSYKSSTYVPQYKNTKIFIENSVPGRQRELQAIKESDHIALRIANENRYKEARSLVKIVSSSDFNRLQRQTKQNKQKPKDLF